MFIAMLVLHGVWMKAKNSGATPFLFLWAECSRRWLKTQGGEPSPVTNRLLLHPFAARDTDLWDACEAVLGATWYRMCLVSEAVAFLPSDATGPRPSPILDSQAQTTEQWLRPWRIQGFALPPEGVVAALSLFAEKLPAVSREVAAGGDFTYWLKAFEFVQSLCRAGQFTPSLIKGDFRDATWYYPVWQPYLAEVAKPLSDLIMAMPDSSAHFFRYTYAAPSYVRQGKQQIALSFIQATMHALIQSALAELPKLSAEPARSPLEVWLSHLLSGATTSLPIAPTGLEQLYRKVSRWQMQSINIAAQSGAFRSCLRLEAPETDNENWRLQYLVHPVDDPSLLLSADSVWDAEVDSFSSVKQFLPNLQEQLLTELYFASQLCAPIADSLMQPRPIGCELTAEEAYKFLDEAVAVLERAGIGVIVPNWWRKETAKFNLRLQIDEPPPGRSFLGVDALATYNVELALGDQQISRAELEQIVALKAPLVRVAGQWRVISAEEARSALALIKRHGSGEFSLGNMIKIAATGELSDWEDDGATITISSVVQPAQLADIIRRLTEERPPSVAVPPAFVGELRHYQLRGLAWLEYLSGLGLGACLADDMGLGKTIQVIAYLLSVKPRNAAARSLIICPTSVINNWQRELAKFAPDLRVMLHYGPDRLGGERFSEQAKSMDVVLTTYGLANRDCELLTGICWDNLIVDEAQNLKNPQAQQTIAVNNIPANCRIALTGTPVENRLSELWSIMNFINPGYLGGLEQFKRAYATPIERYQQPAAKQRLQQVIKPFIMRRVKTDKSIAPDLPEKQETKVYCALTKEQATLYGAVIEVMLPQIAEADIFQRKALIAVTLTKLKQICNHPAHFLKDGSALVNRSNKLTRLVEMLTELHAEGRRALIFTQYTQMGLLLKRHLEAEFELPVLFLHGSLSRKERDQLVTQFQTEETAPPFFILSLKAGGVGLNLTRADTVFHYDRWWNPAVENQATDRAFRIGQTQNVQVYKLIAAATLEEKIDDMIESKKSLANDIISSGEGWMNELSAADLRAVLELHAAGLEE